MISNSLAQALVVLAEGMKEPSGTLCYAKSTSHLSLFCLFVCSNIATVCSVKLDSNADGASESFTARWNLQWRIGLVGGASPLRVRYIACT
jgi:hypothetical protein